MFPIRIVETAKLQCMSSGISLLASSVPSRYTQCARSNAHLMMLFRPSLQDLSLDTAASTPGHALNLGVQRKLAAHLSDCRTAGIDFAPIVVETLKRARLMVPSSLCGRLRRLSPNVLALTIPLPVLVSFFTA